MALATQGVTSGAAAEGRFLLKLSVSLLMVFLSGTAEVSEGENDPPIPWTWAVENESGRWGSLSAESTRWPGRFRVSSTGMRGTPFAGHETGTAFSCDLRGHDNRKNFGFLFALGYQQAEDRHVLSSPLRFRGTEYAAGTPIESRYGVLDVYFNAVAPQSPLHFHYRRMEIETEGAGRRRDKSNDVVMFSVPGYERFTVQEWERDGRTWARLCAGNVRLSMGDLSFQRVAAFAEGDAGLECLLGRDWNLFLGYRASGFYLRGGGSLIEEVSHGPVFQISRKW